MRRFNNEDEVRAFLVGNFTAWKVLFAFECGACGDGEAATLLKLEASDDFRWLRATAFEQVKKVADPVRYKQST